MSSKRHSLNQHIKGEGKGRVLCPVVCVAKVSIAAKIHKHKEICKGNTDDILSSVGVDAFKTMSTVEDFFYHGNLAQISQ